MTPMDRVEARGMGAGTAMPDRIPPAPVRPVIASAGGAVQCRAAEPGRRQSVGATVMAGTAAPAHGRRRLALGVVLALVALLLAWNGMPAYAVEGRGLWALVAACLLYALLLALPFVPSVEIGLLIMAVFGPWGALGAYLATVLGLNLAFAVGRVLGRRDRSGDPAVLRSLSARLSRYGGGFRGRGAAALTLAVVLNLPGNTLLGGGGGISMVFGLCRWLGWRAFSGTVAVATALVPILFVVGLFSAEALLGT